MAGDDKDALAKLKSFDCPNLPCRSVTVYSDRAEVKRVVTCTLKPGSNEIVVKKLPATVDEHSIRVEGKGDASICEVQYREKIVQLEEDIKNSQLEMLEEDRGKAEAKKKLLERERQVLHGVAAQITVGPKEKNDAGSREKRYLLEYENLVESLRVFLGFYGLRVGELNEQIRAASKRQEEIEHQIKVASEKRLVEGKDSDSSIYCREVSIVVEAKKTEKTAELVLSYVVDRASWTPSYDIRFAAGDQTLKMRNWKSSEKNVVFVTLEVSSGGLIGAWGPFELNATEPEVHYYGMIQQNSGEDWLDTELSLSTANPDIGGQVPKLKTLQVDYGSESSLSSSGFVNVPLGAQDKSLPSMYGCGGYFGPPTHAPSMAALGTNSELKAVSPMEEFSCSMGIDPAIRVEYKPSHKFREETGAKGSFVNYMKNAVTTYEQQIEINNTKTGQEPTKIKLFEQIPLSGNEKIKVTLLEPSIPRHEKDAKKLPYKLNKNNILEWDLVVKPGQTIPLVVKYRVEHPVGENVHFSER